MISRMIKLNQKGATPGATIALVVCIILLVAALGFGGWAFSSRQDYKNNVDSKVNDAVTAAKSAQQKADQAKENEDLKSPLLTYNGPEPYGSVVLKYPRSWSAYISDKNTDNSNGTPVDGYFDPAIVPLISDSSSVFSLRIQVLNQNYSDVVQSYNDVLSSGQATFSAFSLKSVPSVVGGRIKGTVNNVEGTNKPVDMVILPVRSSTLVVWTEGSQFENDFNNYILPNLSFSK